MQKSSRDKALANRNRANELNRLWKVGAVQAKYRDTGDWYSLLSKFPAALFDRNGYILFKTEAEFRTLGLRIGKEIGVRGGISSLGGYIDVSRQMPSGGTGDQPARASVERAAQVEARQRYVWKLTVHHQNRDNALAWIREVGRVAVGWGRIGDLREAKPADYHAIGARIRDSYPNLSNSHTGGPSLWNFYSGMQVGDLVIVTGERRDHVVEVAGDYFWASRKDSLGDYQHQRAVEATSLDPDELWAACGGAAKGQPVRWAVCRCAKPAPHRKAALGDGELFEGSRIQVTATRQERNPQARAACLRHYGYACAVCDVMLADRYGKVAEEFIHVHHLDLLAGAPGARKVDPIRDLRPVCPTCHALLHTSRPPLTIDELRAALHRV